MGSDKLVIMTAITVETAQHSLSVTDETGDTKTMWNPAVQDEVDVAKEIFKKMKKKGYLAYSVDREGGQAEVIREFDPTLGAIIMTPQIVGG